MTPHTLVIMFVWLYCCVDLWAEGKLAGVTAVPETVQTLLVIFIKWKGMNQSLRRRKELVIFTW